MEISVYSVEGYKETSENSITVNQHYLNYVVLLSNQKQFNAAILNSLTLCSLQTSVSAGGCSILLEILTLILVLVWN